MKKYILYILLAFATIANAQIITPIEGTLQFVRNAEVRATGAMIDSIPRDFNLCSSYLDTETFVRKDLMTDENGVLDFIAETKTHYTIVDVPNLPLIESVYGELQGFNCNTISNINNNNLLLKNGSMEGYIILPSNSNFGELHLYFDITSTSNTLYIVTQNNEKIRLPANGSGIIKDTSLLDLAQEWVRSAHFKKIEGIWHIALEQQGAYLKDADVGNLNVNKLIASNPADGQVLAFSSAGSGFVPTTLVTGVSSVAGRTGAVTLTKADVALSNCDNTSDANKPISTVTQTALNAKQATLGFTPYNSTNPSGYQTAAQAQAIADSKVQNSLTASTTVAPSATAVNTALATKQATITTGSIGLDKLAQSSATTGQVCTWNGSSWVAATPSDGGGRNVQVFTTTANFNTTNDATGDELTDFNYSCVAGKTYKFEYRLAFSTATATTGIKVWSTPSDATNRTQGYFQASLASTAAATELKLPIPGSQPFITTGLSAGAIGILEISFVYVCATNTTKKLLLGTEVSGVQVQFLPYSSLIVTTLN